MLTASTEAEAMKRDIGALLSESQASTDSADRVAYSRDLWPRQQIRTQAGETAIAPPGLIVWPESTEEVAAVIRYAAKEQIPVVPYGAGSGVCGGILPDARTILVDTKRMRAITEVDRDRLTINVQAGIIGQHLENELNARGFTLGQFPSSIYCSCLGGWLACRAAGQCSGKYGKIEDMTLALTCVDGRGEIHRCDLQTNPALLPLMIGSEGILSVITDAKLCIYPAPTERAFSSWLFPHSEEGLDAIRRIYQAGLRPAVARLYDPFDSMLSRTFSKKDSSGKVDTGEPKRGPGLGVQALTRLIRRPGVINKLIDTVPDGLMGGAKMVLVWEDDPVIAQAEKAEAERICDSYGAKNTGDGPARHWLGHRHSVSYRQSPLMAAGAFVDTMEVASTWSRLWPMYEAVRAAFSPNVFVMAHFSHAYPDGASIYFTMAGSASTPDKMLELYDDTWRQAMSAVMSAGGTLSHHHGVGRSKAPKMRAEQGAAIDVIRALKEIVDPAGILNQGSLIGPRTDPKPAKASQAPTERRQVPDLSKINHILGVDVPSQLIHAQAGTPLVEVEEEARKHGWTFGLHRSVSGLTVGRWLDDGAPGRRDKANDPVDQFIAGLDVVLPDGTRMDLKPAPRRAVGPDLISAIIGARGRLGTIVGAHLIARVSRSDRALAFAFENRAAAESALAWIQGHGVRPLQASIVDGSKLHLELESDGPRAFAIFKVVERTCEERGGSPVDPKTISSPTPVPPVAESPIVKELSKALRGS